MMDLLSNLSSARETWLSIIVLSLPALLLVYASTVYKVLRTPKLEEKPKTLENLINHPSRPESRDSDIVPLPEFEWTATSPMKLRPFKPKYHVTMALTNSSASDLVEMDSNYLDRIKLRRKLMDDHPDVTIAAKDSGAPAVNELCTWLFGTYLPTRFPSMFQVMNDARSGITSLRNLVTGEDILIQALDSPLEALRTLGSHIDDDFLFLLPSPDDDGYTLHAFVTCFPSGFNTREKLDMKLRDIHAPVPGYKEKIERSMDRFFEKLEVGRFVRRSNWAITTHGDLFVPAGSHLYAEEEAKDEVIDVNNVRVRFSRSFSDLEVKEEGLGEELAAAIDGLETGSVPQMHFYKKGVVWGEQVKEFLRS